MDITAIMIYVEKYGKASVTFRIEKERAKDLK
jgi:hypothetical protein